MVVDRKIKLIAAFFVLCAAQALAATPGALRLVSKSVPGEAANGETLAFSFELESSAAIREAVAEIRVADCIVGTAPLAPQAPVPGQIAGQTTWAGTWLAHDLGAGQDNSVTLHATDAAGNRLEDLTPVYPNAISGHTLIGSQDYPQNQLRSYETLKFPSTEKDLAGAVVDSVHGYLYLSRRGAVPGVVVKVRLSDYRRVAEMQMEPADGGIRCMVIEPTHTFIYFVVSGTPNKLVRHRLSDFARVATMNFAAGDSVSDTMLMDAAGTYGYFIVGGTPNRVAKVRMADMAYLGAATLNAGEDRIGAAVIDSVHGFAYLGTFSTPSQVVKVALGAGDALPTRVDGQTMFSVEDQIYSGIIDPGGNYAWFGTLSQPACVIKIRLSDFTRLGRLTLNPGEINFMKVYIDPANGFGYFGSGHGGIYKIGLGVGDALPTRVGRLDIDSSGVQDTRGGAIDLTGGYVYMCPETQPGSVTRVRLSDFTLAGQLNLPAISYNVKTVAADPIGGFLYFGTDTSPAMVLKVRLSDYAFMGALHLDNPETPISVSAVDSAAGFAYFGTGVALGRIVKVRLSDFSRVGAITLSSGEIAVDSIALDPGNFAYVSTNLSVNPVAKIIKIRLSDFTRISDVALATLENNLRCSVYNPVDGNLYLGAARSPARVVKVRTSDMTRIGGLILNSGENGILAGAADFAQDALYFGAASSPGRVIKVKASDLTRQAAIVFPAGDENMNSLVRDASTSNLYAGSSGAPALATRVRLTDFTRLQGFRFKPADKDILCAAPATLGGYAYFGSYNATDGGKVYKMPLPFVGGIRASRFTTSEWGVLQSVKFYVHANAGHIRLALYDGASTTRHLLWQSTDVEFTGANHFVSVPVAVGTPANTAPLKPGTYWLAWQTSTPGNVPSYLPSHYGDGFYLPQGYDNFPSGIDSQTAVTTDERWTSYISFDAVAPQEPNLEGVEADWQSYR